MAPAGSLALLQAQSGGDGPKDKDKDKDREGVVAGVEVRVLDPMERIAGYESLKGWVESGLDGWKVRSPCPLPNVFSSS